MIGINKTGTCEMVLERLGGCMVLVRLVALRLVMLVLHFWVVPEGVFFVLFCFLAVRQSVGGSGKTRMAGTVGVHLGLYQLNCSR